MLLKEVEQLIVGLPGVGTYTRPDNSVIPSVWLTDEPPNTYKVNGVEVIITEQDLKLSNPVGSPGKQRWSGVIQVNLINHSATAAVFRSLYFEVTRRMKIKFYNIDIERQPGTNLILEEFRVRGEFIVDGLTP